jgi:hypothetical protein
VYSVICLLQDYRGILSCHESVLEQVRPRGVTPLMRGVTGEERSCNRKVMEHTPKAVA